LIITVLLHPEINFSKNSDSPKKNLHRPIIDNIKQLEERYKSRLIPTLLAEASAMDTVSQKAVDAQLVFCIDVRSEPFRHHLESLGHYETLGFAGFFGLPIRLHDYNSGKVSDSCPVLLKPRYDIHDGPNHTHTCSEKQHQQGKQMLNGLTDIYQQLKYNFATPFALVETLGAWCGLLMLSKTMKPMSTISTIQHWIEKIRPTVATNPIVDMTSADNTSGISPAEQALYAETVLRIMGLSKNFGKFVIFCGHGSSTQNNPYASGLDCGACGGNHGGGNAKVLAAILNKKSIRSVLSERGIHIPQDTTFLAAEHNTTTDDMLIFEDNTQTLFHAGILSTLQENLKKAKAKNTTSRVRYFDVSSQVSPIEETGRRSQDWSEVRPEWGLARNAAFIIGPRQLTKALDLEGRCFLHSYDWTQDEQLTALETILTAPMVVAEWINTQYLFSTIDNVNYGSGSKVTHNVTGKIGVMQGNSSDLMHGLPLQSVNSSDDLNYHQAQRLLTVVYTPREKVSTIIHRQEILKTLFFNAWVHLIVIEPTENKAYQLQTNGEWALVTNRGAQYELYP
ncbi:MAG: Na-translocating system protein MpsB, partial [Legionellaceae bacterium]|nr:Na-translocating system protein MpsB [Legionellaceae bacterium]